MHQKNADAQVRLQRGGYVHSTHVDGDMPYHTVAVELLRPQTKFHNVCAVILPGQPLLDCEQTRVRLVRVLPHQSMNLAAYSASQGAPQLIVAHGCRHDFFPTSSKEKRQRGSAPAATKLVWFDAGLRPERVFQNPAAARKRGISRSFSHICHKAIKASGTGP